MPKSISDSQIKKCLDRYGVTATDGLLVSIRTYISLLLRWNSRISLTAVTDQLDIAKFHFGESLFAVSAVKIQHGRLADVGSGAGFPGLPLAMMLPNLNVVLIESNLKKATFLSEVIRTLKIENAKVWRGRSEEMPLEPDRKFDFVTARALGHHENLLAWSKANLNHCGKVVLLLGLDEAGRVSSKEEWKWSNPISIPDSERRVILVGSPR